MHPIGVADKTMGPLQLRISVSHNRPPPETIQTDTWSSIAAVWIQNGGPSPIHPSSAPSTRANSP